MNIQGILSDPRVMGGIFLALLWAYDAYHRAFKHGEGFWSSVGSIFGDAVRGLMMMKGRNSQMFADYQKFKEDTVKNHDALVEEVGDIKAIVTDVKNMMPQPQQPTAGAH